MATNLQKILVQFTESGGMMSPDAYYTAEKEITGVIHRVIGKDGVEIDGNEDYNLTIRAQNKLRTRQRERLEKEL